jgi:hypothetical protein
MSVVEIPMPSKQRLLDGQQFFFVGRVLDLGVAELPAFIGDRM